MLFPNANDLNMGLFSGPACQRAAQTEASDIAGMPDHELDFAFEARLPDAAWRCRRSDQILVLK